MKVVLRNRPVKVCFRRMRDDDGRSTPGQIMLDPRLKAQRRLEIWIHEMTHQMMPDLGEDAVAEFAEDMAKVLWDYGYRRVEDI